MGRLTLNILLSFAQFEREIISERVKDKMGAARKKGKWLGGRPILGYELDKVNRKLLINAKDAKIVHEVFDLYLKEKSYLSVAKILNDKGYLTKQYTSKSGKTCGGIKFKNTNIQLILKNVLYIGKVKYNGELYKGEHETIISEDLFNKAQEIIANNRVRRDNSKNTRNTGILNDILRCKACDSVMFHTHSSKKGQRKYRYYICLNAQKRGYSSCPTRSVNAQVIEDAVITNLRAIAANSTDKELKEALIVDSPIWETLFPQEKHRALKLMLKEAAYSATDGKIDLTLNHNGIKSLYLLQHPELQRHLK
jgi:site-specific DNA recombinase